MWLDPKGACPLPSGNFWKHPCEWEYILRGDNDCYRHTGTCFLLRSCLSRLHADRVSDSSTFSSLERFQNNVLDQWFSKYGAWINSCCFTWELVKSKLLDTTPHLLTEMFWGWGPAVWVSKSPPGYSKAN